ncbi:MAG: hypothetical protein ACI8RZ_005377 [Myxococcota bacterium]|jgi:hypothetical protein
MTQTMFPSSLLTLLLAGCSFGTPQTTPESAPERIISALSDAQVTNALSPHQVLHWDEWVRSAELTDEQQATLDAGKALAGIAPTPIRHSNGFLEVDSATFDQVDAGELAVHINFGAWFAAGLYDERVTAHRIAAVSWVRGNPEPAMQQIPALSTAGRTDTTKFVMDTGMGGADTGSGSDTGMGGADTGTILCDGGSCAGDTDDDMPNCQVTCDIVVDAEPSTAVTGDGEFDPDNICGDEYDGELWEWHVTGGAHPSFAGADGGSPNAQDSGACTCSTDTTNKTTVATELRVKATCSAGAIDDNEPADCPAGLEWEVKGWGDAQQSLNASASAEKVSSDDFYNGCTETAWSAQADIAARCGATGATYNSVSGTAEHNQSCNTATTVSGGLSLSTTYKSEGVGSWETTGGGGVSKSITTTCEDNEGIDSTVFVDCNARGPETVMTSDTNPLGTLIWAGVGGGAFRAQAKSVADAIGDSDDYGGHAEAELSGMSTLTVEVRECAAWDDSGVTVMFPCVLTESGTEATETHAITRHL